MTHFHRFIPACLLVAACSSDPVAPSPAADATVADSASKASSTNHDWYDEDLSESSDAGRSSPAILEDLAGSGVTNSTGDGKKYLARESVPAPPSFNEDDQSSLPLDQREEATVIGFLSLNVCDSTVLPCVSSTKCLVQLRSKFLMRGPQRTFEQIVAT